MSYISFLALLLLSCFVVLPRSFSVYVIGYGTNDPTLGGEDSIKGATDPKPLKPFPNHVPLAIGFGITG